MNGVLKYWEKALRELEGSSRTFADIYRVMFRFGGNVFFEWNENGQTARMTYDACRVRIERAARVFSDTLKSVPHGTFIGLKLQNSPAWVITFWALMMAGYRPLLLHPQSDDEATRRLLAEANAPALAAEAPLSGTLFLDAGAVAQQPFTDDGFTPKFADGLALCSSGTSGQPKLCVFDGKAVSAQILNSGYVMRRNSTIETYDHGQARLLAFLPFCHVFGLVACLLWFSFFGATFVFLKDYGPRTISDTCRRLHVTHVFGVPLLFRTVASAVHRQAETEGKRDQLSRALAFSVRLQTVFPRLGAAFVRKVLFSRVRARVLGPTVRFCITGGGFISGQTLFTLNGLGYALYNGYGSTEIGIGSVELRLPAKLRLSGTVGEPFPSCRYRVTDAGELEVSGESLYTALLKNGEELPRTEEWHRTGDLTSRDGSGQYAVLGRADDLIVTEAGENLSPDALEDAFSVAHVARVCVVGDRGADARVTVTLVAEWENGLPPFVEQMTLLKLDAVNRALPQGSRVQRILIADAPLPVALTTKVCRGAVRDMLRDGTLPAHEARIPQAAGAGTEGRTALPGILKIFGEVFERDDIAPETHLVYDLGCDSLRYYTLSARIADAYRTEFPLTGEALPMTPQAFSDLIEKQNRAEE